MDYTHRQKIPSGLFQNLLILVIVFLEKVRSFERVKACLVSCKIIISEELLYSLVKCKIEGI